MASSPLNRETRLYVSGVVAAGSLVILHSAYSLISSPPDVHWLLLAALTLISGSANVRLASVPATISVSETFVCTSVLLFGGAAGTVTVALDAVVMSLRLEKGRRSGLYRLLFNITAPSVSVWIAARLFVLAGIPPLSGYTAQIRLIDLALPLLFFALIYFLLNSWLVVLVVALAENLPAFRVWRDNLLWTSLNYFGGASVAALLVAYRSSLDVALLLVVAPILVVLHFTFRSVLGRIEDANLHLARVNRLYLSTIETLATAIDAKDQVTHGHIRRVQTFAVELAKSVGIKDEDQIRAIEAAALLHDMGKLAVPEHILNKPGPLNEAELERMRSHAAIGADILASINFPYPVVPIVRHHHENWDGSGYPAGLKGTEIPVGARVLSVVDCFDALTSDRPYRPRLSTQEALEILAARRGKMYDPLIVDTFVRILDGMSHEEPSAATQKIEALAKRAAIRKAPPGQNLPIRLLDAAQLSLNSLVREGKAAVAILFVSDRDATRLRAVVVAGNADPLLGSLEIEVGERLSGWVAANGRPIVNSDPALDLGYDLANRMELGNAISVPANTGQAGPVSVLTAYSEKSTSFSSEDSAQISQRAKYLAALMGEPISS